MTALEDNQLPRGVIVNVKGRKTPKEVKKFQHKLKLNFRQKCPEASEIRKLHPSIRVVFVPRRPSNVRYCILKFTSAKACEEVREALHGKHIEPYNGILKCSDTTSKTISKLTGLKSKDLRKKRLNRAEVKLLKIVSNGEKEPTIDVKCNSTARELFVRYGVTSGNEKGRDS